MTRQLADNELGQRLLTIPGVGPITASVLAAEMGDGKQYECSRDFAASIGLVPRQYSTGGKANLLGISGATKTFGAYWCSALGLTCSGSNGRAALDPVAPFKPAIRRLPVPIRGAHQTAAAARARDDVQRQPPFRPADTCLDI